MADTKPLVVVLSGIGENNAINGLMRSLSDYCREGGLEVAYFDLAQFDQKRFFELMASGQVSFGITYLGIGQSLEVQLKTGGTRNIWEFYNVPLLKLHGDTPAYFLARHENVPRNGVNLYGAEEFLAFHRRVFPHQEGLSAIFDPWIIDPHPEASLDFPLRAKGQLFFIKSGGDPEEVRQLWRNQLPGHLCRHLLNLSEVAAELGLGLRLPPLHGLVEDYFAGQRIDLRLDAPLIAFFVAQVDDYLRKLKATLVGQALVQCPVVIQGNRWEHLDLSRAVATVRPAQDFAETMAIFQHQLGVIDLSPNVDTVCHDRLFRAAGTYAFALTNKSGWLEGLHPELNQAAFTFHPEAIQEAVHAALKDPERCVEWGRQFGRAFRSRYRPGDFVDRLCTVADLSRLRHANPKPLLQPYQVW
ncbi:MAG: hypothetical protein HY014_17270 [Acidobacteria bacterium]|nr:hypothetical protein [Acidobacteriota bacterium]MBI3489885.1 hypothetical protein [Acidobacteriota bacterium]